MVLRKKKAQAKPGKPNIPKGASTAKGIQARRNAGDKRIEAQKLAVQENVYAKPVHKAGIITEAATPLIAAQVNLKEERKQRFREAHANRVMAREEAAQKAYEPARAKQLADEYNAKMHAQGGRQVLREHLEKQTLKHVKETPHEPFRFRREHASTDMPYTVAFDL